MKRAIPSLLLVLLLQLTLVAIVYWPATDTRPAATNSPLPALNVDRVDRLTITDGEGAQARLEKIAGRWQLPELHMLPADPEKVTKLFDTLLNQANNWPVANSVAARQRFEVADYLFRRKVELFAEDESLGAVYLGSSPGFRKVHTRVAGQSDIRSLTFNVHDAPARSGAWIDPKLLQVRTPMRIDADAYSVHREGGQWQSGTGGEPDQRELLALLTALRTLRVQGVAVSARVATLADTEAELVLDIDSLSGRLQLSLFQKDGRYFIRSSEFAATFRLSAYDFDRLTGINFLLISGHVDNGAR